MWAEEVQAGLGAIEISLRFIISCRKSIGEQLDTIIAALLADQI